MGRKTIFIERESRLWEIDVEAKSETQLLMCKKSFALRSDQQLDAMIAETVENRLRYSVKSAEPASDQGLGPLNTRTQILWICQTSAMAKEKWIQLGRPANVRTIGTGVMLASARYDIILVDKLYPDASDILKEAYEQWFADSVACCLSRHGQIVYLHDDA